MISKKKNEDAVSPVIGVMLMLVVTVVIAAVVVTFSTGLAGSTGTTPTAMFEVSDIETYPNKYGNTLGYLNIKHKGGDVIPLSDIQITLESIGGDNGGIIHTYTAGNSKYKTDMSDGTTDIAPDFTKDMYLDAKPEMDAKLAEYKTLLESMGIDSNKYGTVCNEWYQWEDFNYLNNYVIQNYPDKYYQWYGLAESIAYNTAFSIEYIEGWTFYDGKLIMITGSSAYPISVLGQGKPTESTVSTGDIILVVPYGENDLNSQIYAGTAVKWTISYIPTNSIIAKGEFEVIAD